MNLEAMKISRATVPTESAQSYMRKLGKHWSHRFPVHFDENSGCAIQLPTASCELLAHPDRLDVRLSLEKRRRSRPNGEGSGRARKALCVSGRTSIRLGPRRVAL